MTLILEPISSVWALINSLYSTEGVYLDETLFYGTMVHSTELHNELISILARASPIDEVAQGKCLTAENREEREDGQRDGQREAGKTTVRSAREKEGESERERERESERWRLRSMKCGHHLCPLPDCAQTYFTF